MRRAVACWVLLALPIAPSLAAATTAPADNPSAVRLTTPRACPPPEGQTLSLSHPWLDEGTGDLVTAGDFVVLLEDNPPACPELKAGQAGIIVRRDDPSHPGEFLVSWISYRDGAGAADACGAAEPAIFPPGSAAWIDPNDVLLGRPFDECGTLWKTPEGCPFLQSEAGRVYSLVPADEISRTLDATTEILYAEWVRVRGLVNTTAPPTDEVGLCSQVDGDVYHPVITPAATAEEADGCIAAMGDRVIQLYKDPEASNRLLGCVTVALQLDFRGRLDVEVTPTDVADGTWQGFAMPELAGPGVTSVNILIQAEDVDLNDLSWGSGTHTAEVSLVVLPAK